MNTTEPVTTDLSQLLEQGLKASTSGGSGDWLGPLRARAAAEARELGLPERKQEAWRYTPVGFLDRARYEPAGPGVFGTLQLSDVDELLLADGTGPRLVFVNGYLAPALSILDGARGVVLSTLSGGLGDVPVDLQSQLDHVAEHRHAFAALNSALMSDGALIHVPADVSVEHPIEILHVSVGMDNPQICHPRHLFVLGDRARAHLIERYVSLGDGVYFNNVMVEVALGMYGELVHERLQEESPNAQHLTDLQVRLAERSRYRQVTVAVGGNWSRNDIKATFSGPGASAEFDGLMLARDRQLNDVHLDVHHDVPECTSREDFRGILDGQGRVVFDGRVIVARDAQKTDAMLSNHNLMLSRSAEVDTKPQLEIFADDVKCSHGTTVGELDPEMLYYLRSRGIPAETARQMLCLGFAEDVLARITDASLGKRARELLAARLVESW